MTVVVTWGGDQDGDYKSDININKWYSYNWILLLNADKKKVISKRRKQRVKVGDVKGSKTGNEINKIKKLKRQNSKLKRKIKALNKKVTNDNDEWDDNNKPEDSGDQFGGNQSKNKPKKNWLIGLYYNVPWIFISLYYEAYFKMA